MSLRNATQTPRGEEKRWHLSTCPEEQSALQRNAFQWCAVHRTVWWTTQVRLVVLNVFYHVSFSSFVCLWFMMNIDWYLWHEYSSSAIAAGIYCGQVTVTLIPHVEVDFAFSNSAAAYKVFLQMARPWVLYRFVQHCSLFWWRCRFHCTADGWEQQKVTSRGDADKSFDVFPKDHKGHRLVNKYIPGTSRHRASNGNHSMPCVCLCPGCAMGQWSKCERIEFFVLHGITFWSTTSKEPMMLSRTSIFDHFWRCLWIWPRQGWTVRASLVHVLQISWQHVATRPSIGTGKDHSRWCSLVRRFPDQMLQVGEGLSDLGRLDAMPHLFYFLCGTCQLQWYGMVVIEVLPKLIRTPFWMCREARCVSFGHS